MFSGKNAVVFQVVKKYKKPLLPLRQENDAPEFAGLTFHPANDIIKVT